PVLRRAIEDTAVVHVSRAVEQDIERWQLVERRSYRRVVEHIENSCRDIGHARVIVQQLGVDIGRVHLRAFARHGENGGFADALTSRRDQRDLAHQSSTHTMTPRLFSSGPRLSFIGTNWSGHFTNLGVACRVYTAP